MAWSWGRLRRGELLAGVSALVVLVLMFALKWFRPAGSHSLNGWNGLTHLRWLVLVTIVAALALVYVQASSRAPAFPVSMSVAVTLVGAITFLWLAYRVLISPPSHEQAGAFLGLLGTLGIACGGYMSMHEEGTDPEARSADVRTVTMEKEAGS